MLIFDGIQLLEEMLFSKENSAFSECQAVGSYGLNPGTNPHTILVIHYKVREQLLDIGMSPKTVGNNKALKIQHGWP